LPRREIPAGLAAGPAVAHVATAVDFGCHQLGRRPMGVLLTICPVTAREIATGIEPDRATMARVADFAARIRCPQCGGEHVLSKQNAWVCQRIGDGEFFSPEA
jgi:hypothetical protein